MPLKREIGDMVEYVDNIFKDAIKKWASDIHIEPNEKFLLMENSAEND
jgi:type II secretory ATPase GspE/PulE/Tfp pilus assembly ATPase PilB-like protein